MRNFLPKLNVPPFLFLVSCDEKPASHHSLVSYKSVLQPPYIKLKATLKEKMKAILKVSLQTANRQQSEDVIGVCAELLENRDVRLRR